MARIAIIRLGYSAEYAVPVEKISKFLETIESVKRTDNSYIDNRFVRYYRDDADIDVTLMDSGEFLTNAEYKTLQAEVEARRLAEAEETPEEV